MVKQRERWDLGRTDQGVLRRKKAASDASSRVLKERPLPFPFLGSLPTKSNLFPAPTEFCSLASRRTEAIECETRLTPRPPSLDTSRTKTRLSPFASHLLLSADSEPPLTPTPPPTAMEQQLASVLLATLSPDATTRGQAEHELEAVLANPGQFGRSLLKRSMSRWGGQG